MPETSFWGMPIQAGPDLYAFLTCTRSVRSALQVGNRVARHLLDLARHGCAIQLVNGVALIGKLTKSAEDLGVETWVTCPATRLLVEGNRVVGVESQTAEGSVTLRARKGVVLAAGGFPHDVERRKALFPRTPTGREHWPLPPPSAHGDGLRLGESARGQVDTSLASPVAWAPVSLVPHRNGTVGHFPHIIDRAKPGVVGVLVNGRRLVNEAHGYYDYVAVMIEAVPEGHEVASWLVCDHRFLRRYGLGIVRPTPLPYRQWIRAGYLMKGDTLKALASRCGIDPEGLERTASQYNAHARRGDDPEFGRGSTPYSRKQGGPDHSPNPCVAPLETAPFCAIKVVPGSFGTFAGLKTNENAQVLDRDERPIAGLYAAGADMASIMGGFYPSGGINLGPAMTFGFIAGRLAASASARDDLRDRPAAISSPATSRS